MLRPYLPGLVTSSSIAASPASVYRLPSWVPSAGSAAGTSPGSGAAATSIIGCPPQATARACGRDRPTRISVPSTWLRSRVPGLSFTLALLSEHVPDLARPSAGSRLELQRLVGAA